jgi:hypothetical protein
MPLNEQVVDAVTNEEFKNVAGLHALTAGLSAQNQLTNQQAVDAIMRESLQSGITFHREIMAGSVDLSRAVRAKAIRDIFNVGQEASAFDKTMAAGLESKLANIEGLLAAGQQQEKTAITSPPQTGTGGAFGSDSGSALAQQLVNMNTVLEAILARLPAPK